MATSHLSPISTGPMPSEEDTKPFACSVCVQRKVKCNKRFPCLSCLKSRLQCQYRNTPPPQRRKRRAESTSGLLEVLNPHDATHRSAPFGYGSNEVHEDRQERVIESIENGQGHPLPTPPLHVAPVSVRPQPPYRAILVPENGGSRYYEHGLIGSLGQEYRQDPIQPTAEGTSFGSSPHTITHIPHKEPADFIAASLLTGPPPTQTWQVGPGYQDPPAGAVLKCWSIFVENVHPVTKIIHLPSVLSMMMDEDSAGQKKNNTLKFAICACAVASLSEVECQQIFGDIQAVLLNNFQSATRQALLEASFLRIPDLDLLRAHVIFLTSMLHSSDTTSLWMLMGTITRLAQTQGLHRDGTTLNLSIFETEMRRRLWWYIITLDGRLHELNGAENNLLRSMDTLLPSNLNDSDLHPEMRTPIERMGATEMTFCLLKYEVARFLQEQDPSSGSFGGSGAFGGRVHLKEKENGKLEDNAKRSILDLEDYLEQKFLRFCDPVVPLQFLTTTVARSILGKVRQMVHYRISPNDPQTKTTTIEQSNRKLRGVTRSIEYHNLLCSTKSLRGFLWLINFEFPWVPAFILLKVLVSQSGEWDEDTRAAWRQIEELYENHPEFVTGDKVEYLILGGLALKVWASRDVGGMNQQVPSIVTTLQRRQKMFCPNINGNEGIGGGFATFPDSEGWESSNYADFEVMDLAFAGVYWNDWEYY